MSHSSIKGHRKFTRDSALAVVHKCKGAKVKVGDTDAVVILDDSSRPGNGTWGALDYLRRHHKFGIFRRYGKMEVLCD